MSKKLDWENIAASYKTHNEQLIGKARQVDRLLKEKEQQAERSKALVEVTDAALRMIDDSLKGTGAGNVAIKPDGSLTLIDGWKVLADFKRGQS